MAFPSPNGTLRNSIRPEFVNGGTFLIVMFFLWSTYARIPELLALMLDTSIPTARIQSIFVVLALVFAPRLISQTIATRYAFWLGLFTVWIVVTAITATWHGGAFGLLKAIWLPSLFVFFAIAPVLHTAKQMHTAYVALQLSILTICLISLQFGRQIEGRAAIGGSLGNANDYAVHILLMLPVTLFLLVSNRTSLWLRPVGLVMSGWILYTASRAGSRTAMLVVITMVIMGFIMVSGSKKVLMVAGGSIFLIGSLVLLPTDLRTRYLTLFSSETSSYDRSERDVAVSAEESSAERRRLALLSIKMTLQKPLFGVGAGNFVSQATSVSEGTSDRVFWRAAHTVYGQLGAELGIPGLLIYLCMSISPIAMCYRIRKQFIYGLSEPEVEMAGLATALLISQVAYAVGSTFGTSTYGIYIPLFLALTCGLERAARTLSAERSLALSRPAATPAPVPAFAGAGLGFAPPVAAKVEDVPSGQGRLWGPPAHKALRR